MIEFVKNDTKIFTPMIVSRDKHYLIQQIRKTFEYNAPIQKKRELYKVPENPLQTTQLSLPELKPEDSYSDMENSVQEVESNTSADSKTEPVYVEDETVREPLQFHKVSITGQRISKLSEILNQNNLDNPMATQYAQFVCIFYLGSKE
jgi:hypothetical protein